jgi:hypothetical protein
MGLHLDQYKGAEQMPFQLAVFVVSFEQVVRFLRFLLEVFILERLGLQI